MQFQELITKAKKDDDFLLKLLEKYKPLMIKYSTIDSVFYEDLYSEILEVSIEAIKKFDI